MKYDLPDALTVEADGPVRLLDFQRKSKRS